MQMIRRSIALVVAATALAACGSDSTAPKDVSLENQIWAPSLGIDLSAMTKLPSGVYYQDITVGTGTTAAPTSTIAANYTGWLADGRVFSNGFLDPSSLESGVIQGWKFGVPGMQVGGKRRLVIPSALGYGPSGSGPIPGNANLVFNIELLNVS